MGSTPTTNGDPLRTYRNKRDPAATPEPFGASRPPASRFVVQLHAARARHYDFRLEHAGVLLSWAVPKGPSLDPADKRLAVRTEDHPVDYVDFEGVIPEGNYGAGAVIVWDRGHFEPAADFDAGLANGKLLFDLHGHKLHGRWTLVKTKRSEKDWLLIKERDAQVRQGEAARLPDDSVLSGLTVEQLAAGENPEQTLVESCRQAGAEPADLRLADVRPMLATPGGPFSDPGWLFEIKYDGYRLLAGKERGRVLLLSRSGRNFSDVFPDVAAAVAALPYDGFLIDGEVVVHGPDGLPSFAALQQRGLLTKRGDIARAAVASPASLYAFDLPLAVGYDLRPLPLLERKRLLASALPSAGAIRYAEHIVGDGERMYAEIGKLGVEGIVGKRADSSYVGRRSTDWRKISTRTTDDFAVVGALPPKSGRRPFGALLLAQRTAAGWQYAGRVGSGFTARDLETLGAKLAAAQPAPPPLDYDEEARDARWHEPAAVVEVRFKARSPNGRLRQPVFLAIRSDKTPEDCWVAADEPPPLPVEDAADTPAGERRAVRITNPQKVFWPDEHYTKQDLVDYYTAIAPYLLPYLRDRPLVLTRYPDGVNGKSFYQKDAPEFVPDWLRLESLWSEGSEREIRYFVLEDEAGLAYVANMAAIPLHVWSSRIGSLERPDWCILDLDPKEAPFRDVIRVARTLYALCEAVGLPSYVKTSGSTGMHVLIPLGARYTHELSRSMAELLARCAVRELPEIATIKRQLNARDGKVYVDYLQNGHGRLLVAPFSARAVRGATVSMPLRWSQVTSRLDMHRYTIKTVPEMLAKQLEDPLAGVLHEAADLPAALERLAALMSAS